MPERRTPTPSRPARTRAAAARAAELEAITSKTAGVTEPAESEQRHKARQRPAGQCPPHRLLYGRGGPKAGRSALRMSNKPINIVIVEDLQIVADGLAALLNNEPDMRARPCGSVAESAAQAAELSTDWRSRLSMTTERGTLAGSEMRGPRGEVGSS